MKKVIAICGKICSGKSYYAKQLMLKEKAVILSCDEVTKVLFDNNLGEKHDEMSKRIWNYLLLKAVDITNINVTVILDWGFWVKKDREFISNYFKSKKIFIEWHYVDVEEKTWQKNIEERNALVLKDGSTSNYYVDEGLIAKLLSKWQEPESEEINVYHKVVR